MVKTVSELTYICSHKGSHFFAVLEEAKGWKSPHSKVGFETGSSLIHVDFYEEDMWILRCKSLEDGSNLLAWRTPWSVAINHNETISGGIECAVEIIGIVAVQQ